MLANFTWLILTFSSCYILFMFLLFGHLKNPLENLEIKDELQHYHGDAIVATSDVFKNGSEGRNSTDADINISVLVGKKEIYVSVNNFELLRFNYSHRNHSVGPNPLEFGGIYLLVLHEGNGRSLKQAERFATFDLGSNQLLIKELSSIQPGRIVILASVYETVYSLSLTTKKFLMKRGSKGIGDIGHGDRFLMIWTEGGKVWTEAVATCQTKPCIVWQGGILQLSLTVPATKQKETKFCKDWPDDEKWNFRRSFCENYEGYKKLCSCSDPLIVEDSNKHLQEFPHLKDAAMVIITSKNRATLLSRCLMRLYNTSGFNSENTLVAIDGVNQEVKYLIDIFNLEQVDHISGLTNASMRITHHYYIALKSVFQRFPSAQLTIVLEDDLLVAPDFFRYFNQLIPTLLSDKSLYCISAWNDFAAPHTSSDSRVVLRTDTMPGLGWLLTKELFQELEPTWPAKGEYVDWDMWLRIDKQRKGRQCLIPEVLRTYHFGAKGVHTSPSIQHYIYQFRTMNTDPSVDLIDLDKLQEKQYYDYMQNKIKSAVHLNASTVNPCADEVIPQNDTRTYVLWFKMNNWDDEFTYEGLFSCLDLWHNDVRGGYYSVWSLRYFGTEFLLIGWPISPFWKLKPADVGPLRRTTGFLNETEPVVEIFSPSDNVTLE